MQFNFAARILLVLALDYNFLDYDYEDDEEGA
jgi:hypothetical protein